MRIESDSLGSMGVDEERYYGIQTLRAMENFSISGFGISDVPGYVPSIILIKKCTAIANYQCAALDESVSQAICQAADEFILNPSRSEFPLDIFQGGGGTSTNMNVNEVLANRANEILTGSKGYAHVHPNTHVNMCQSTNDVIPAAMKITAYHMLGHLQLTVRKFVEVLGVKETEFNDVVKLGRTCLQDALPLTLGQQFSGYKGGFTRVAAELDRVRELCLHLPIGATAIGTGLGVRSGYEDAFFNALRHETKLPFSQESNLFDGLQNADIWINVSALLKTLGNLLNKLASDLRLMSSGPRAGLSEITLPAVQPGSSIMPGKVNPVIPEMAIQVYFRVLGNDLTITRACEGELELNVWESVILNCFSESCRLLTNCLPLVAEKCLKDLTANGDICRSHAENSLALSTVIATMYDYEVASKIAKQAERENKNIKQVVIETGLMTAAIADTVLDPLVMTSAEKFNAFVGS